MPSRLPGAEHIHAIRTVTMRGSSQSSSRVSGLREVIDMLREGHTMRARTSVLMLALLTIAAAACGSSSNKGAGSSSSTTVGSANGSTITSSPSGPTTSTSFTGSSGSSFCDYGRRAQAAFSGSAAARTPQQLRTLYANLGPILDHAHSLAPDAIRPDFDIYVTGYRQLVKVIAAANYDVTKVSRTAVQAVETPQVTAASQHIAQYFQQVCHLSTTPTT
jgi:hypothetical protein